MTKDKSELVEALARALCGAWDYAWDGDPSDDQTAPETDQPYDDRPSKALFRLGATEALATLEARIPGLSGVIDGTHVVVPKEPTAAKLQSMAEAALIGLGYGVNPHLQNPKDVYAAAMEPGKEE